MMKNNNSYKLPLALVFSLFFLWAISSNLLPTMIRQLMKTCELNTFEASSEPYVILSHHTALVIISLACSQLSNGRTSPDLTSLYDAANVVLLSEIF